MKPIFQFFAIIVMLACFVGGLLYGVKLLFDYKDNNTEAHSGDYMMIKRVYAEYPSVRPLILESMSDNYLSIVEERAIRDSVELIDVRREREEALKAIKSYREYVEGIEE